MSDEILKRDQNRVTVMAGVTNDADKDIKMFRVDPISKRLLIAVDGDTVLGSTFESISKNLKSYPYTFNKTGDVLDSITYTLPSGTITKTFNRTGTVLNTVVLSGSTPSGIDLTKTFNRTGSVLTSITYA